jgi:hypothetical protein
MTTWYRGEPPKDGKAYIGFFPGLPAVADQRFVPITWSLWGGGVWDNATSGHHMSCAPSHWSEMLTPPPESEWWPSSFEPDGSDIYYPGMLRCEDGKFRKPPQ